MSTIAEFKINYLQYLNEHSEIIQPIPSDITLDLLVTLYKHMVLIRAFDTKAINLQRTGKMGTFPASTGHEAISAGMGHSMRPEDILCPYYRDQGILLLRNVSMQEILLYWGGDERGSCYQHNQHDLPNCVPIASQCLHAAGVAFAVNYRNQKKAVVTTIGDGGTSKGDFYEALNVAGCWNLPVVFVAINNQWAISVPRHKQTRAETLAQKAIAAGFEGIQIDGNDVISVLVAMKQALHKAYAGQGPTLIEAISYRLCDHTTADDASRYSDKHVLAQAWEHEPIRRLRRYLESQQQWSTEAETAWQRACSEQVEKEVALYLKQPSQPPTEIIDYLFATLPRALREQREQIEDFAQ